MAAISMGPGSTSFPPPNDLQDVFAGWDHTTNGRNETSSHSSTDYDASNPRLDGAADGIFASRESRRNSLAMDEPQTKHVADNTILKLRDENSKWIHRDKLAKIESEELQAAGITLPKSRTQSRPRRDRSQSRRRATTTDSSDPVSRSRKDTDLNYEKPLETEASDWDLRVPDEVPETPSEQLVAKGPGKATRIPVPKISPVPISGDHMDRNTPTQLKSGGSKSSGSLLDEEPSFMYSKSRSRSSSIANALDDATSKTQTGKRHMADGSPKKSSTVDVSPKKSSTVDVSPKKSSTIDVSPKKSSTIDVSPKKSSGLDGSPKKSSATTARKTPTSTKSTPQGRAKARSNTTSKGSSGTRPPTRPGELSAKAPEGDPPWMISAYQPDPRLPPDQQLLPTVARRLQQEKWEQEGALGSVFDKDFRPLNTGTFGTPPECEKPLETETEEPQIEENAKDEESEKIEERENEKNEANEANEANEVNEETEKNDKSEWPLKPEARAPTPTRSATNSYSTMPKIQDVPATNSITSSKPVQAQNQGLATVRVPETSEQHEAESDKAGCGCCIIM